MSRIILYHTEIERFNYQFQNQNNDTLIYANQIITILGIHYQSTDLFHITSNGRRGVYYLLLPY